MSDVNTVNIEDVFNMAVDKEEAKAISASLLLPQGDYITVTPLNVGEPRLREVATYGERVNGTVQQLDEPQTIERVLVQFYGQAIDESGTNQGKVSFNISPQAVFKVNSRGKFGPDLVTKITQSVMKIYKQERGAEVDNYGELIEFVKTTPLKLFVGKMDATEQYEASNLVFSVSRAG